MCYVNIVGWIEIVLKYLEKCNIVTDEKKKQTIYDVMLEDELIQNKKWIVDTILVIHVNVYLNLSDYKNCAS